jgi:hypothetical protein
MELTDYKAGAVRAGVEESWNLAAAITEDLYRKKQAEALERIMSGDDWEERPISMIDLLDEVELESRKIASHRAGMARLADTTPNKRPWPNKKPWWKRWGK